MQESRKGVRKGCPALGRLEGGAQGGGRKKHALRMPRGTPEPLQAAFSLERRARVSWRTKPQLSGKRQPPRFFFRQPGDSDLEPVATRGGRGGQRSPPSPKERTRLHPLPPETSPATPKRAARTHRSPALLLAHPSRPSRLCTPRAGEEPREGPPARLPPRLPPRRARPIS